MNQTERMVTRLATASNLGITIEHADGHRWIRSRPTNWFDFDEVLRERGVLLNNKIYGSVEAALDTIDAALRLCGHKTLEENCWFSDDIYSSGHDESRITKVSTGKGGLC